MDNSRSPVLRLTKKGRLSPPQVAAGPGPNCKGSSMAACNAIVAILGNGTSPDEVRKRDLALDQSVVKQYLEP